MRQGSYSAHHDDLEFDSFNWLRKIVSLCMEHYERCHRQKILNLQFSGWKMQELILKAIEYQSQIFH